jgi:hypothetical protein
MGLPSRCQRKPKDLWARAVLSVPHRGLRRALSAGVERLSRRARISSVFWSGMAGVIICHAETDPPRRPAENGRMRRKPNWAVVVRGKSEGEHSRFPSNWPRMLLSQVQFFRPTLVLGCKRSNATSCHRHGTKPQVARRWPSRSGQL